MSLPREEATREHETTAREQETATCGQATTARVQVLSASERGTERRIVFVCRNPVGESLRAARALGKLDGVRLFGICERMTRDDAREVFAELVRVEDVHNAGQLMTVARSLCERNGALAALVTAQETLLEPVALASEALGLGGMSAATVRRALDKSRFKRVLAQAEVRTARGRVLTRGEEARRFAKEVGFPLVLKPLGGSGGLATWRVGGAAQLERALDVLRPSEEKAVLAEEYLRGEELCIDTITIANEPRFHTICYYRPSILEALEETRVQWSCVMPRDIACERYREFTERGLAAVRALKVGNAVTHMEGFLLKAGGVCFTDATLRPAGARIGPMLGFACDTDTHRVWARATIDGCFDGPWERKYSVGTVFLRGQGRGRVESVSGLDAVRQSVGDVIVESRLPRVGASKSATYTGDGYVTVRHEETSVVEEALRFIAETVRIAYSDRESHAASGDATAEQLSRRLRYFDEQLNRPAWDDDSLPSLDDA